MFSTKGLAKIKNQDESFILNDKWCKEKQQVAVIKTA
jgi:hypothetical protein